MLYFDHNATTPLAPEVGESMLTAMRETYGNASSTHRAGQMARQRLEEARRIIAAQLGVSPLELVFTSGGTEANNLAISGLVRALGGRPHHLIATAIEHPSVLEVVRYHEREGFPVSLIDVDISGAVDPDAVGREIGDETLLVSIMHANNETGVIQPIREIAALVQKRRRAGQAIFLHSDGVQAFGKIASDVAAMGADLYSISAHKLYGPKGMGALVVRKGTPLVAMQLGGRHERARRAGTENVPAAIGFARAMKLGGAADSENVSRLRDRFEAALAQRLRGIKINGTRDRRLPNTSNVLFEGIPAQALLIALDMQGMAVSTGSACSSGSVEPSHVLLAMGRSRDEAQSCVRFSFGRVNSEDDVTALADATVAAVTRLREQTEKRLAG